MPGCTLQAISSWSACGHMSCFWCVHKAMSGLQQSHCPICRHPYYHFPSICKLIHHVIIKLHPKAYTRRRKEVLEEETKTDVFSPQFVDYSSTMELSSYAHEASSYAHKTSSLKSSEAFMDGLALDPCHADENGFSESSCLRGFEANNNFSSEQTNMLKDVEVDGMANAISIVNVLCVACKQLLIQPSVLNCGHVYCEACVPISKDEAIICQVCQSLHPGGFPNVCLELKNFLIEEFPEEYAQRKAILHGDGVCGKQNEPSAGATQSNKVTSSSSKWPITDDVHFGVGCDSCGMYPIIGERYKCLDCKESVGFDLCGDCYKTSSKLPGRFNQQHTPEHRFELVRASRLIRIMAGQNSSDMAVALEEGFRIMNGQSDDDFHFNVVPNESSEELEDLIPDFMNEQTEDFHSNIISNVAPAESEAPESVDPDISSENSGDMMQQGNQ